MRPTTGVSGSCEYPVVAERSRDILANGLGNDEQQDVSGHDDHSLIFRGPRTIRPLKPSDLIAFQRREKIRDEPDSFLTRLNEICRESHEF